MEERFRSISRSSDLRASDADNRFSEAYNFKIIHAGPPRIAAVDAAVELIGKLVFSSVTGVWQLARAFRER